MKIKKCIHAGAERGTLISLYLWAQQASLLLSRRTAPKEERCLLRDMRGLPVTRLLWARDRARDGQVPTSQVGLPAARRLLAVSPLRTPTPWHVQCGHLYSENNGGACHAWT